MKRIKILIFVLSMFSLLIQAKSSDIKYHVEPETVPKQAKKYVARNYPEAYNLRWDFKKKESLYKSDFKVKGEKYRLVFSPAGKLIFFKGKVSTSELPAKVKKYIKKYYTGFNITGVEKTLSFKYATYKIGLDGDFYGKTKHKEIRFDQKGNLLD